MRIRPAAERLHSQLNWLNSWHSFSFGQHYDPAWMGSGALRVINDDVIAPGTGFGTHGHNDMEIITVVLSGTLSHQDSAGNEGTITPGRVQRMSAGSGIRHSEYNHSPDEPVHLLQIWIEPHSQGLAPGYQEADVPVQAGKVVLAGKGGLLSINQDAELAQFQLAAGESVTFSAAAKRVRYLHIIEGTLDSAAGAFGPGDGVELSAGEQLQLTSRGSRFLAFDVPA